MNRRNPIGIMQGRLLPKYKGRYQAHPVGYWHREFELAAGLGIVQIEFILDHDDWEKNPLMSDSGLDDLKSVIDKSGVGVKSVCADYFMESPLHSDDENEASLGRDVLSILIRNSSRIGITDIVIPCVDGSSFSGNEKKINHFVNNLMHLLEEAHSHNVYLDIEADLPPHELCELIDRFGSEMIGVNYDTGNSASLGYDPAFELEVYGKHIRDIHIKDRVRDGGSVPLGEGDTDFDSFCNALKRIDYDGPFIMQAYRDDEGISVFRDQFEWIKSKLTIWIGDK